jgi:hypothetical protein
MAIGDIESVENERPQSRVRIVILYTIALFVACVLLFLWFWMRVGHGGRIPIDYIVKERPSYNSSASFVYK